MEPEIESVTVDVKARINETFAITEIIQVFENPIKASTCENYSFIRQ